MTVNTLLVHLALAATDFRGELRLPGVFETKFTSKRVDEIQQKSQT